MIPGGAGWGQRAKRQMPALPRGTRLQNVTVLTRSADVRLFPVAIGSASAAELPEFRMDHSAKVKQLEETRRGKPVRLMIIYPIANQQGCAMGHFQFTQAAGSVQLQKSVLKGAAE